MKKKENKETNKEKIERLEKYYEDTQRDYRKSWDISQMHRKELHLTKKKLAYVRKQVMNKEETIQWLWEKIREFEKRESVKYGFNNSVNVARTEDNI